jgi:hypothetical protein
MKEAIRSSETLVLTHGVTSQKTAFLIGIFIHPLFFLYFLFSFSLLLFCIYFTVASFSSLYHILACFHALFLPSFFHPSLISSLDTFKLRYVTASPTRCAHCTRTSGD